MGNFCAPLQFLNSAVIMKEIAAQLRSSTQEKPSAQNFSHNMIVVSVAREADIQAATLISVSISWLLIIFFTSFVPYLLEIFL